MSSLVTLFDAVSGCTNGVPQVASSHVGLQTVLFTHTIPPWTHVAQS
jgi:hypothetical protein